MASSTKKPSAPKSTRTKAKSTPSKTKVSTAAQDVETLVDESLIASTFETQEDVASEAEGLVDPDALVETSGFAPVPVRGVTRAIPAHDNADDMASATGDDNVTDSASGPDNKLMKKDLVDRVIARSGVKPRYVRQVAEAMLEELGLMLEEAETLQIQPLGTLKVQRRKDVDDGEVIICKLKRKKPDSETNDPLAAAAE